MKKRRKSDFAAGAFSALTGGIGAGGSLIKKSIQPKNGSMKSVGRGKDSSYHRVNNHIKSINPYGYKKNTEGYLGYSENLQRKYKNPVNAGYSKDYGIKSGYEKKYTEPYEAYYGKGKEEDNASEYLKTLNPYGIKIGNKNVKGVLSGDFKGRESIHGIKGNSGGSASYNNGIGAGFAKKEPNRQKGVFDRGKDTNITNPLYLKEKENGRGVLSLNPYGYKAESKKAGGNGTAGERSPYGNYIQKSRSFGYPKSFGVNRYFDILDKGTGKRTHKIESAKNEDRAYRYGVYGGNGFRVTPYTKREERAEDFQKPERSNSKRFYDLLYKKNFNKYNYIGPPDFEDVKKYPNLNNNQLINIKNDEEKFKNADMSLPKYNNYMERKDYLDKKNKIYSNNQVNRQLKLYGADKLNFNNVYALIKNPGFEYMSISDLNNMSILDRQRVYCIFRNEGLKERNNYISNLKKVNKKDREKQEYINYLNSSHFDPIEEFADLGRKNEISNKLKNVKKAMELMLGDYSVSDKSFVNLTADYFKENGTEEQKEAMDAGKTEINIGYGLLSGYLNTLLSLTLNTLDSYGGVYNSSAEYDSNTETLKDIKEKAKRESLAGLTADIVAGGVGLDTDAIKEIDFLSKEIGVPIVEWILSGIMKNNIYRKDE